VGEALPRVLDGTFGEPQIPERLREVLDSQPWGDPHLLQHTVQRTGARQLSLSRRKMANEAGQPTLALLTIDQTV
jgi:hypothetical protein